MLEISAAGAKVIAMALPFMTISNGSIKVNTPKIIESLIVGIVIATTGYFVALPKVIENIAEIKVAVKEIDNKIEARRGIRDAQIDALKREVSDLRLELARARK